MDQNCLKKKNCLRTGFYEYAHQNLNYYYPHNFTICKKNSTLIEVLKCLFGGKTTILQF